MKRLNLRPTMLLLFTLLSMGMIGLVELVLNAGRNGTFLLTLSFWTALVQGSVALVAAAEAAQGKWLQPIQRDLLAFYPMILVMAGLFLFLGFKMEIYPWLGETHRWLNPSFFLVRNAVVLVLSFLVAHFFARATLQNRPSKGTLAIFYLFLFVISQSLVAFDWIMPLEYPWMSTLFGGIFFMESFYLGIAVAVLLAGAQLRRQNGTPSEIRKVLRDSATFMFGFALAWAGLFYAQYLVIWYGNLPEETEFILRRMHFSPYRELFYGSILLLFVVPFVTLVSRKTKSSPAVVSLMALVVLSGVILERIVYIAPAVPLSGWAAALEFTLLGLLVAFYFQSREKLLPGDSLVESPTREAGEKIRG